MSVLPYTIVELLAHPADDKAETLSFTIEVFIGSSISCKSTIASLSMSLNRRWAEMLTFSLHDVSSRRGYLRLLHDETRYYSSSEARPSYPSMR